MAVVMNVRKIVDVQTNDDDMIDVPEVSSTSLMNADLLSSRRSHAASAYLELREK